MSISFRKTATASAVALAALAAGATSAQADIQKKLEYTCKYPLVDKKPLTIDITSNIPAFAKLNEQQPAFVVNAVATAKDGTSEAIETLDAYKLDGVSEARASLVFPSGFVQGNLKVPLTIAPYIRAANAPVPDPLVLTATGKTPSVNLDELGNTDIRLDTISLRLHAYYADGTEIKVKPLTTDFEGKPVTQTDIDLPGFAVYCKLNADQNPIIATICVNNTGLPNEPCPGSEPVNNPPTKNTGLKVDATTLTSATISWDPSTDPDGDPVSYKVYKDGTYVETVSGTSYTATGLNAATKYTFRVEPTDGELNGTEGVIDATTKTDGLPVDTTAPSAPVAKFDSVKYCPAKTVKISWTASTDEAGGSGLKGYVLTYKGETIDVPAGTTSYTLNVASPSELVSVSVAAVDNAGNVSAVSTLTEPTPPPGTVFNCQPQKPVVKLGTPTATSIPLSWTQQTGIYAPTVKFNIYRNGVKVGEAPAAATTYTDTGLPINTATFSYVVEAVTAEGVGVKSDPVTATVIIEETCLQGFACYEYGLKGSTSLKTLTTGTLPLTGGIKAQLAVADGKFTADLTLNNTNGRLTAAGFLPLTAKVGFVPVGKTTGQLDDATATKPQSISTNSKVRIKVLEVKLFGAIPLAGGNSCQTKSLSDINLKSTNAFDPLKGGTIGGTYAISDLNGCGPLNGLVSPLTAGKGNTITLDLVKK